MNLRALKYTNQYESETVEANKRHCDQHRNGHLTISRSSREPIE